MSATSAFVACTLMASLFQSAGAQSTVSRNVTDSSVSTSAEIPTITVVMTTVVYGNGSLPAVQSTVAQNWNVNSVTTSSELPTAGMSTVSRQNDSIPTGAQSTETTSISVINATQSGQLTAAAVGAVTSATVGSVSVSEALVGQVTQSQTVASQTMLNTSTPAKNASIEVATVPTTTAAAATAAATAAAIMTTSVVNSILLSPSTTETASSASTVGQVTQSQTVASQTMLNTSTPAENVSIEVATVPTTTAAATAAAATAAAIMTTSNVNSILLSPSTTVTAASASTVGQVTQSQTVASQTMLNTSTPAKNASIEVATVPTTTAAATAAAATAAATMTTSTVNSILLSPSATKAAASASTVPSGLPVPTVNIPGLGRTNGRRMSLADGDVDAFVGIPFAKPPVGDLRFRAPVPLEGQWAGDLDATKPPAACCQLNATEFFSQFYSQFLTGNGRMSEDCLYLNVWKPAAASTSSLKAVMVWLYGGAFVAGSSSSPIYDASVLASKGDVVVVSMNYRLGIFGFLSMNDDSARGNYGLLDQQLALRWIHDHIAAFGGDPQRVTLFGESAGSMSISCHLMSPGSESLFRRAIMESGVETSPIMFLTTDTAKSYSLAVAKLVNCRTGDRTETDADIVSCLRGKDAFLLTYSQFGSNGELIFLPTVDGTFLTDSPANLLASGQFQNKSILIGVNSDEGGTNLIGQIPDVFPPIPQPVDNMNDSTYRSLVGRLLNTSDPRQVAGTAFEYITPCQPTSASQSITHYSALQNLLGDVVFTCPARNFSLTFAGRNLPVFVYTFVHRDPLSSWPSWVGEGLHGDEINFVFGRPFDPDFAANFTDSDRQLSGRMVAYWTNFAKSGDPNGAASETPTTMTIWPKFTTSGRLVLVLNTADSLQTQFGLRERKCMFLTSVLPQLQTPAAENGAKKANITSSFVAALLLLSAVVNRRLISP